MRLTHLLLISLGIALSFWDIFNLPYIINYASAYFGVKSTDPMSDLPLTAEMVGYALGGVVNGYLSSKRGRKPGLLVSMGLVTVGSFMGMISPTYVFVVISEFIIGFGLEGELASAITYVSEDAEAGKRGRSVGVSVVLGFLVSLVVGPISLFLALYNWRFIYLMGVLVGLPVTVGRTILPESRLWISRRNDRIPQWSRNAVYALFLVWFMSYFTGYTLFSSFVNAFFTQRGFDYPLYFTYILYGDPLGVVLSTIVNDYIERKYSASIYNIASGLLIFLWPFTRSFTTIIVGFLLMFMQGAKFPSMYSFTAESIATPLRSVGVGVADGLGHLGGAVGPLVGVFAYDISPLAGFVVIAVPSLLAGFLILGTGRKVNNVQLV